MKTFIVAFAVFGVVAAVPALAQSQWSKSDGSRGSAQFRLDNEEGAAIIMGCGLDGVYLGFEFPDVLDQPERATMRGIPGERYNVSVSQVGDRVAQVTSGRGIDDTFQLLRSVPRVEVRVPGQSALFNVSGSDSVVAECLQRQDEAIRNPTPRFPNTSPEDE